MVGIGILLQQFAAEGIFTQEIDLAEFGGRAILLASAHTQHLIEAALAAHRLITVMNGDYPEAPVIKAIRHEADIVGRLVVGKAISLRGFSYRQPAYTADIWHGTLNPASSI